MISSQQQLATAVTLPQPEVPKFSGDPMKYKTFIMAFDARIQSREASDADRLYYVDQHLTGGCLQIEPDEGYTEARKLLQREHGDPYKVSNAFMQKLSSWPVIKYDDGLALKRFSFFLTKCNNAMKTITHVTVLNHPPNMQSIVQKLPNNLQTKWRENVVKDRRKERKRYGPLFTCLVSRVVHIEVANSLETDSFLNALCRFIARRGPVREIRSDNRTNFVGATRELREAMEKMDHNKITEKLRQQQIDWKFNPPVASHMGGVWERQI